MNQVQNSVTLIGNLGQDPSLYQFDNGNKLLRFSLATSEYRKNAKGEKVTETMWHSCVAYGKLADLMNGLLAKGRKVAVGGRLRYGQYKDKDGVERHKVDIVVDNFQLLDKPQEAKVA
ncbi:MAG: single-stranded DNA-binding protein [Lewinella sp.]|nr:single-stranded DNA-binding protein [Lewinella sp.]